MAKLVGTFFHSHGGTTSLDPARWEDVRTSRPIHPDVQVDDHETNLAKGARIHDAFRVLREKVAEVETDVLVVFSDDQLECFDFNNYPAFSIFVGDTFRKGHVRPGRELFNQNAVGRKAEGGTTFNGHKKLAVELLAGVMKRGFDPAFNMDMPKEERGLASGVIRTAEELTDFTLPIVPVMMNLYFAPQPTAYRCYQFGKAVREVIDAMPGDLRVSVAASGGLWHTPGMPGAWLNTEFDLTTLDMLKRGDALGMARHFDDYVIPDDDTSQDTTQRARAITGMPSPGGPALGTRETCAWVAAAAVSEGRPTTIIDYVDAYASPAGNAFAYCDDV
jgi:3-O-methylgallate 3,4-dioxygenase